MSIRTVADFVFPETVSFPSKQPLTLHGAFEDVSLLAPYVSDDTETWDVLTEEIGSADVLEYDGRVNDNALRFKKTKTVEIAMALDTDSGSVDDAQLEADEPPKFGDGTPADFQQTRIC